MAKRILTIVLGIYLLLSYIPAKAAYVNQNIKVGLFYAGTAKSSLDFKVTGNAVIGYEQGNGFYAFLEEQTGQVSVQKGDGIYLRIGDAFETLQQALAFGKNDLKLGGTQNILGYIDEKYVLMMGPYDNINEAQSTGETIRKNSGYICTVQQAGADSVLATVGEAYRFLFVHNSYHFAVKPAAWDGYTQIGTKKYAGIILFNRVAGSDMTVINLLPTEEYLYSVVGSEMPPSWPIEALKVQAVASRTYVASYGTQFAKYGFQLAGSTVSQAYEGLGQKTAKTIEAVNATAGQVVLYDGKTISALFGSMSGGRTADSRSAWGSKTYIPYLRSVDDSYEKTEENGGVWKVELTVAQLKEKLAARGVEVGEILDVTVLERGEGDERVTKLRITGTLGEKVLTYESNRTYFGLKSQYYTVSRSGSDAPPVYVLSADGMKSVSIAGASVLGATNGTVSANTWMMGAGGVTALPVSNSGNFIFSGRGYGHGVGMSQYGSKSMAEMGFGYEEILLHYYPDTQLGK